MNSASTFSDPIQIQSGISEFLVLPERPLPDYGNQLIVHGQLPAQDQVRVIFTQEALQKIEQHSQTDKRVELGGILLGHPFRSGGQIYVEVEGILVAKSDQNGPVHFTFTADVWAQIHRDQKQEYPGLEIVGWFHTHPGLGIFFSTDDLIVHQAAFSLPWHVGLVVDPVQQEVGLFGWVQKQIRPLNGFYEKKGLQSESVIDWRWGKGVTVWSMTDQVIGWPEISPWWGVFLGGFSLLLNILLIWERFLTK